MLIDVELITYGLILVIGLFKLNCEFTYSIIPDYKQFFFYVKIMLVTDIFHLACLKQVGRL